MNLECPDWTYFSKNECYDCLCNVTNTERCDKRSGKCICKSGYEGDLCNCKINTCNIDVAFCQDNENGTRCLCKPGYENRGFNCEDSMRLNSTRNLTSSYKNVKYRIGDSWISGYAPRYSNPQYYGVCERLGLPTFYNKLSSYAVPPDTELVDSTCMKDEFSRLNLNYTKCEKKVDDNYFFYLTRAKAETATCLSDCPNMMFFNATSFDCVPCSCNNNNTKSCNQTTGECTCKAGFYGASCDCVQNQHNCNNTFSYCTFQGTSPACNCRVGFYGKKLGCFESLRFIRNTGVLQMYHQEQWMLIGSSYSWDNKESKIVCTQLGLPSFYMSYVSTRRSQTGLMYSDYNNRKRITYLSCNGDEKEASQCRFSTSSYMSSYSSLAVLECRS
ncbi:laminin subunit alpha lam-3-like, partial [Saccostrea cucullata]|uniref:laminin subunit alpha lam-3-like n=1 Tax=Saccostrea cuccullata TaxID=36930 RepID=UPI002ED009FD